MPMNSSVRAELRKEHRVCAIRPFSSTRTEGGVGQKTPDAGACRFLLLQEGVFVLPEHRTTLSILYCQRVGVRLGSEAAEQTHTSHQVGERNGALHPPTSPLSHSM